jgi:hypothetical protein
MTMTRERHVTSGRKKEHNRLLAIILITTVLLACVSTVGFQTPPKASANSDISRNAAGNGLLDPLAYMYGYHLYNMTNWGIPLEGGNFSLSFPANWNVTSLGLNFFNGTVGKGTIVNSTPVTTSVTSLSGIGYLGTFSSFKIPPNSNLTIYQALFNITALRVGQTSSWVTANDQSNTTFPLIDGNLGISQRFFIANRAQNLSVQISMFRFEGTVGNLTVEVRSSTSDSHIGALIKSASISAVSIPLAKGPVTVNIPYVNLTAGSYFIVLHTKDWVSSGGGYSAETTLSKIASNPTSGWLTSNRGVDWQSQVDIAGVLYYFNGFKLKVRVTPQPTPSDLNLKINGFTVADNFIWNQTVWNSASPYGFVISSDYPLPLLNFTYKLWTYVYGFSRPFPKGYHIMINGNKNLNSTPSDTQHNFTMMHAALGMSDLFKQGVVNSSASTINLNLRLFANSSLAIAGTVNVTATVQLVMKPVSETFTGPYSLKLQFKINHTEPAGPQNNITLTEDSLAIGPINNVVDNVIIDDESVARNSWTYDLGNRFLNISREAFASLPEFTLLYGSSFNCTITTFNNSTADTAVAIKGNQPYTTPIASIQIQNSTPILDLDGPILVNFTVTNPSGVLVNNTRVTLAGGLYIFNWTFAGEGVYGIEILSVDPTGFVATRWIGAATVSDYQLSSPRLTLDPSGNLTSQQSVTISANVTYVNQPGFTFNGTVRFSIYVGETGTITQLVATKNSTTGLYQAVYQVPMVNSVTLLTIRAEACDLKNRISTNLASTYLLPTNNPPPPNPEPSSLGIIELAIVAVILLVPTFAYLIAKYRKR